MGYAVRKDARDVASSSSPLDRTPNDVDDEMEGDCFVSAVPKDLFVAALFVLVVGTLVGWRTILASP